MKLSKLIKILTIICISTNILLPAVAQQLTVDQNNYLKVTLNDKKLHSKLANKYDGYEYTIYNVYNEPVKIQSITIWNNANAAVAYLSVRKTGKETANEVLSKGAKYALPTLSLSLISSGIVIPFCVLGNRTINNNAQKEAANFDTKPKEAFTIAPGEKKVIKTMAMKKHSPVFNMIFLNPITDENMDFKLSI